MLPYYCIACAFLTLQFRSKRTVFTLYCAAAVFCHWIYIYIFVVWAGVACSRSSFTQNILNMVLQILLVISVILQLVAAVIAVRLMSRTKYNASWVLISIALVAMTVIRVAEYTQVVWDKDLKLPQYFFVWMGVATSLCFAIGVFLIQKILNWIDRLNFQQTVDHSAHRGERALAFLGRASRRPRPAAFFGQDVAFGPRPADHDAGK